MTRIHFTLCAAATTLAYACASEEPGGASPNPTEPVTATPTESTAAPSVSATDPVPPATTVPGSAGAPGAGGAPTSTLPDPTVDPTASVPAGTAGAPTTGGMGGASGMGGAVAGGMGGMPMAGGMGGMGGMGPQAPDMLSGTGLFTEKGVDGALVLAEGVREFEPLYWLWSDGSGKRRYVYLPPGTQIDTSDPDHWAFPAGTKFWKSFISGTQLVETRLIEKTGDGPEDWLFATYAWTTPDATDAVKMDYKDPWINAAGTTHDIPSGPSCEKCHIGLKDRVLGFSALQLNHDLPGVTLASLMDEGLLTDAISLDIGMPGDDEVTQNVVGYFHANCGNCHNDQPGLPIESVPAPQLMLRVLVDDLTLEDTGLFQTAINQRSTASSDLPVDYRIFGGDIDQSAVRFRMTLRMIEDQMPPIGTETQDEEGLAMIEEWIMSLPPPTE